MPPPVIDVRALDEAVDAVSRQKGAGVAVPVAGRIDLLRPCLHRYLGTAPDVVAAGCEAKGPDPRSPAAAEEWMSGPVPAHRHVDAAGRGRGVTVLAAAVRP